MRQKLNIIFYNTFLLSIFDIGTSKQLTTSSIISSYKYPVEVHNVETTDGYILKIFRIPSSPRWDDTDYVLPKPVFFLQHGLMCSSDIFVLNGPDDGLPFMLADAGYDVWLGNARGNVYSRRHTQLDPEENEFWQFSWHEIGIYDMPAMIEHMLESTFQTSFHYVGHSQGGTTLLVMLSLLPEFNAKLRTCHLLAPAAWMGDLSLPKLLTKYISSLPDMEFTANRKIFSFISSWCKHNTNLCRKFFLIFTGKFSPHTNNTAALLLLKTNPSVISTRQIKHYLQLKESGKFCQYDYGRATNMAIYGHRMPEEYPLDAIYPYSEINIYYSLDDQVISTRDIHRLGKHLPQRQMHLIDLRNWRHMDFILSKSVKYYINTPILEAAIEFDVATRKNRYNIYNRHNG